MEFNAHNAKMELIYMMNDGMITTEEMSNMWNIVDDAEADLATVEVGCGMARAFHVGDDAYTVEVLIGRGACAYHVGPLGFPYFTREQAERVAERVNIAGFIRPVFWTDGYLNPLQASDVVARPPLALA